MEDRGEGRHQPKGGLNERSASYAPPAKGSGKAQKDV